jgi:isochorismate hydrolase
MATTQMTVHGAQPAPFSFNPRTTALVIIDMQRDFIEPGGFGAALGNDVSQLAAIVPGVAALLAFAREQGWLVVHTRRPNACAARRMRASATLARWGVFSCAANRAARSSPNLRRSRANS